MSLIKKFDNAYLKFLVIESADYEKSLAYQIELDLINSGFSSEELVTHKQKLKNTPISMPSTDYVDSIDLDHPDLLGSEDHLSDDYTGGWDNMPDK